VLTHKYRSGGAIETFHQSDVVTRLAGRAITSRKEYSEWTKGLSQNQSIQLSKAWNEKYFEFFGPNELIRLRDYREIAPGVWIPFREDRAWTHLAQDGSKRHKYTHLWVSVKDVRTDLDLSQTIQDLQPRDGDLIQDQRFGVVLNFTYRKDRTEKELLEMVDAEYQKQAANEKLIKKITAPFEELVGKLAPPLPTDGWVGGDAPQFHGKPYLIHFWATWCGPCKHDLPLLKKLAASGVRVVGMHPAGVPAESVAKIIAERELSYPTYVASHNIDETDRKIGGFPTGIFPYCILVDSDGRVAGHGSLGPDLMAKFRDLTPE
jgi:thiol-disulfide isomerase/thioredoxin